MARSRTLTITLALMWLWMSASRAGAQVTYAIVDLGTLGGYSYPWAINDNGEVSGASLSYVDFFQHAFLYTGSVMMQIDPAGTVGKFINASGQVVGEYNAGYYSGPYAFIYSGGVLTDVGNFGGTFMLPTGLNDLGEVCGTGTDASGNRVAWLYSGGALTDLGTLGGPLAVPTGINNSSHVVGWSFVQAGVNEEGGPIYIHRAFLYQNGQMDDITPPGSTVGDSLRINHNDQVLLGADLPGGAYNLIVYDARKRTYTDTGIPGVHSANASSVFLNANGDVAGYGPDGQHILVYSNGVLTDLGAASYGPLITGFNNARQVVGTSTQGVYSYFYGWVSLNGVITDLNTLIPPGSGWTILEAQGINNRGEIVAYGLGPGGVEHALLLIPSNHVPIADSQAISTPENTPVSFKLTASDPDGDTLTFSLVRPPAHGTISGTLPDLTYTPTQDYNGPDSLTFQVSDGSLFNTGTINITVTPVNHPPVATSAFLTTPQDTPVAILLIGSDPDGDPLTYQIVTPPAHGVLSGTAPNVTYTPNAGYSGPDNFTFKVNDGQADSAPATVSITITPVAGNRPPVAGDDAAATTSDTPVTISVLVNDSDPDGDPLTIASVSSVSGGAKAVINAGGTITYTPKSRFVGVDTFQYTVSDGRGGTATATVTVTVSAPNSPPRARKDNVSTTQDIPVIIDVLANDSDPDGDPLTVSAITTPGNGMVRINANGTVTYTPNTGFTGRDSFSYTISDGRGGTDTATVTVLVKKAH